MVIAPLLRGTRGHDTFAVSARQPVIRNRTAAKKRGQRPPDDAALARGIEFLEPEKPKAPISGS